MPGQGLLFATMDADPSVEDEFNDWYEHRYIPQLLSVPGFLNARRFRALDASPKYLALYDLEDVSVLERPEYVRLRAWGSEAAPRDREMYSQFRNLIRGVYQRLITLPDPEPADPSGLSPLGRSLAAAPALLAMGLDVDAARDEEFNAWYDAEHLPALVGAPGVLRARRYKLHSTAPGIGEAPTTYLALYDLDSPEAQATEEWDRRRKTPWSHRMRRFFTRARRGLYERIWPV